MDAETFKAHFMTGLSHQQSGNFDQAKAVWQQLLDARPDSAEALSQLGLARFWSGEQEAGLADMRQALEMAADKAPIHYHLASLLLELGNQGEAATHLAAAGRHAGDNGMLVGLIVDDLNRLDQTPTALEIAETAVSGAPDDARLQAAYAKALLAAGRIAAAGTAAAAAYEAMPADPFVLEAYAAAMILAGRSDETAAALATIENMPSEMLERAFIVIARLLEANGDYYRAYRFHESLVAGGTDTLSVMVDFARLAMAQGAVDDADRALDRVLRRSPDMAPALMLKGEVHLRREDPAKGIPALRRALELNPSLVDCYRLMADHAPGSLTDADRHALLALSADADLPDATRQKAASLLDR